MSFTLIETKTLGTAAASIEFTSIPQDFTDIVFLLSLRTSRTETDDPIEMRINGGATAISARMLRGSGSAASSITSTTDIYYGNAASNTANTFDNASVYFPNYAGSTNKSFSVDGVMETNATSCFQFLTAGLWSNTSAITSVLFRSRTLNNLVAGSTVSLYGILKGSDGIVTTS
jgi:hypothetical protein